ncbi:MAG: cell wall hydrolase [Bacillota bacterium]|jgi:N-acetylmuramoyl-L-alanine amidase
MMNTVKRKRIAVVCLAAFAFVLAFSAMPGKALAYSPTYSGYTQSELDLLARVVHGEAAGEPYVGKVAVAAVVLNRVHSHLFPDTIAGVIYEPWQFSCVGGWLFNSTPSADSYKAAVDALNGWDPTYGALYYFNYHIVTNAWLWAKPHTITIGNHYFTY